MGAGGVLERLAELIVEFGANVQPGQIVALSSEPGKEPLARAVAEAAYRRGAKFVDLSVFDVHLKRARALYAPEDTLEFVPPWYGERTLQLGELRCARIGLLGPVAPHAMDGIDPVRAGRDMLPRVKEGSVLLRERTTNWCLAPCPTIDWASFVHPELDPQAALARLWHEIAHICRLDEPDPKVAWEERIGQLQASASALTGRRFDALHFEGPGTDLTVGLFASADWTCASFSTVDGIEHVPNIPTEEVFTTPDPLRTSGYVSSTKPLVISGSVIKGLRVEFEAGSAVRIDAEEGAEVLRALAARDAGAARLGEVALVDGAGRIGPLETVFFDTLLDENAASHIALGQGFHQAITDESELPLVNESEIHIDFMIGGDEVSVTGLTAAGERVPVLVRGEWQIEVPPLI